MFGPCKEGWENPEDPRYTTRAPLAAAVLKLIPELMLQKLVDVEIGNGEMGYQQFYSDLPEMFEMMKTNNQLEDEAWTQKALSDRNNEHIREICIVTANACVANTGRLTKGPPRSAYTKPDCNIVTQADHPLPHLHSGAASDIHEELRKNFLILARQDVRRAHYVHYKREFSPALIAIYDIIRNSKAWDRKDRSKLAPEDKSIYRQAP